MINKLKKIVFSFLTLVLVFSPALSVAQQVHGGTTEFIEAKVLEIIDEYTQTLPGTDSEFLIQDIRVEITEEEMDGRIVELQNDLLKLKEGESVFLNHHIDINGIESFSVRDVDRRGWLISLAVLFVITIITFAGKQGVRSLVSLIASILVIVYLLIPGILAGYNPAVISTLLATGILFFAVFFTHGFNRESTIAFAGTVLAVIITGILAYVSVKLVRLTGFSSDESVYLNLNTGGMIDFGGLLLGAIIIGVLGVLDDIAITQSSIVSQLKSANKNLNPKIIYKKAIKVGKDHVGALVNTLALAYVGTSLPLLLLFANANASFWININSEVFATEIVRTLVGSIGLILTVPITTLLAVYFLKPREDADDVPGGHSH